MRCQDCNQHEAAVRVIDQEKRVYHLCKRCAEARTQAVSTVTLSLQVGVKENRETASVCSVCGMRFAEFQSGGLFGCASCYPAFEAELDRLFKRIHGANRHRTGAPGAEEDHKENLVFLEQRLRESVGREAFEEAAQLRDRIAMLKARQRETR